MGEKMASPVGGLLIGSWNKPRRPQHSFSSFSACPGARGGTVSIQRQKGSCGSKNLEAEIN